MKATWVHSSPFSFLQASNWETLSLHPSTTSAPNLFARFSRMVLCPSTHSTKQKMINHKVEPHNLQTWTKGRNMSYKNIESLSKSEVKTWWQKCLCLKFVMQEKQMLWKMNDCWRMKIPWWHNNPTRLFVIACGWYGATGQNTNAKQLKLLSEATNLWNSFSPLNDFLETKKKKHSLLDWQTSSAVLLSLFLLSG